MYLVFRVSSSQHLNTEQCFIPPAETQFHSEGFFFNPSPVCLCAPVKKTTEAGYTHDCISVEVNAATIHLLPEKQMKETKVAPQRKEYMILTRTVQTVKPSPQTLVSTTSLQNSD